MLSGGTTTYALDPDTDFAVGETCTVTVDNQGVTDADTVDPPDVMAADFTFSFATVGIAARIYQIQGAAHVSPLDGQLVSAVPASSRRCAEQLHDPGRHRRRLDATSDAILVFRTGIGASVTVGQAVTVSGRVTEFRPGGATSAT